LVSQRATCHAIRARSIPASATKQKARI